jgi:hypothetical protein
VPKARPAGHAENTRSEHAPGVVELARRVVAVLGGRYRHLGLPAARSDGAVLAGLGVAGGLDVRDLEAGLVQLDLAHGRAMSGCPGGQACTALRLPMR